MDNLLDISDDKGNAVTRRLIPVFWVVVLQLFGATMALADDFSKARDLVKAQAPNIVYSQFCSEAPTGADKAACRISKIPSVAFLVCQKHELDGAACKTVIATEIKNLTSVSRAGMATVTFKTDILGEVACFAERSTECYGYLAGWVSDGRFVNLDDAINAGKILDVADSIEKYTKPGGAVATARKIQAIIEFMKASRGKFSRVCDLQGFYLQPGGFVINDVPELIVNSSSKPVCGETGSPSYDQVLEGLETLVDHLK
jgi:hypothetical protein